MLGSCIFSHYLADIVVYMMLHDEAVPVYHVYCDCNVSSSLISCTSSLYHMLNVSKYAKLMDS